MINLIPVVQGYSATVKGCFRDTQGTWDDGECHEHTYPVYSKYCVCKHDLCNNIEVSKVGKTIQSIGLILLTLLASFFKS